MKITIMKRFLMVTLVLFIVGISIPPTVALGSSDWEIGYTIDLDQEVDQTFVVTAEVIWLGTGQEVVFQDSCKQLDSLVINITPNSDLLILWPDENTLLSIGADQILKAMNISRRPIVFLTAKKVEVINIGYSLS